MADAAFYKRWKVSEALLRRAHGVLPRPVGEGCLRSLQKKFFEYLEHNEHELALDMLQELGELARPRGGFWKDLVRAAENMGLSQRVPYFEKKFHEALLRLGGNEKKA